MKLFHLGLNQRSTGFTQMNQASSRSHAIFSVHLVTSTTSSPNDHQLVQKNFSKFQFVDLAGSERVNKTKNILGGDRFKEGIFINAGLHSLGNVISALSSQSTPDSKSNIKHQKKNYIPYRESKLTRLLKDCLGGNSKTILISCISQNPSDLNESLNTLRYSIRAKKIENTTQKITKVIAAPRPRLNSSTSSRIVRRKTSPLRTRTGVNNTKPELKKPMIKMNDLMKIKALKSIVNNVQHSSSDELDLQHHKIIQTYLSQQVLRFIEYSSHPSRRLEMESADSRMMMIIKKEISSTLSHHFVEPHSPSSNTSKIGSFGFRGKDHHSIARIKNSVEFPKQDLNQFFDFLVDLHSLLGAFNL